MIVTFFTKAYGDWKCDINKSEKWSNHKGHGRYNYGFPYQPSRRDPASQRSLLAETMQVNLSPGSKNVELSGSLMVE